MLFLLTDTYIISNLFYIFIEGFSKSFIIYEYINKETNCFKNIRYVSAKVAKQINATSLNGIVALFKRLSKKFMY